MDSCNPFLKSYSFSFQTKHDELETLELAIERQKSSLQQLKEAERKVEREKDEALKVLQDLKLENEKITRRR